MTSDMTPKQLLKINRYEVQDYFMACSTCLHRDYTPTDGVLYCTKANMGFIEQQWLDAAVHDDGIRDLYEREG